MVGKIRIAGIVKESIVDGPGIRYVVFAQGCKHNCPGCHNPETHSFDGGILVDIEDLIQQMKQNPLIDGITLSGGDPFEQAEGFGELAMRAKKQGYSVMTYTGYTFEYILKNMESIEGWRKLLTNTDMLVDGRFDINKKSLELKYKGSYNQRIIDVKQSIDLTDAMYYSGNVCEEAPIVQLQPEN
ncbi:MAG: Pyruvate formate-lyase 1-activating enzyme [Firmicutes bacterium ADurb.Bin419]|nr:MAG: Pyruvate formate-lyase 1-activating enzyme [Firmicutes bacterium ADurb.Bin419]